MAANRANRTRAGRWGGLAGLLGLLVMVTAVATPLAARQPAPPTAGDPAVYLPLTLNGVCAVDTTPRLNAPRFTGEIPFGETAVAWFGQVSPTQNYADIRVGTNAAELYVYLAIFDHDLWYDASPTPESLTQWDAVTLLLDTDGSPAFSSATWRFVAQLYGEPSPERRAVYRGSTAGWQAVNVPFAAVPGWRGSALNNNTESDRGWAMGFTIPFSSLGLIAAPPEGWDMTQRTSTLTQKGESANPLRSVEMVAMPLVGHFRKLVVAGIDCGCESRALLGTFGGLVTLAPIAVVHDGTSAQFRPTARGPR